MENIESALNRIRADRSGKLYEQFKLKQRVALRPGWLTDDQQWKDQILAMTEDDIAWLASSWELAGGSEPSVDMSW